jgi:hypothetical protein
LGGHRQVAELVDDRELRAVPEAHRGRPASFDRGLGGSGDGVGGRSGGVTGGRVARSIYFYNVEMADDGGEWRPAWITERMSVI